MQQPVTVSSAPDLVESLGEDPQAGQHALDGRAATPNGQLGELERNALIAKVNEVNDTMAYVAKL
jgi:hypothetical protein